MNRKNNDNTCVHTFSNERWSDWRLMAHSLFAMKKIKKKKLNWRQTVKCPDREWQVLLVFPKNDDVCEIIQDACSRLEMDSFLSCTLSDAMAKFQNVTNGGHNLIIVDGRSPQMLDPELVARYVDRQINSLTILFTQTKWWYLEKSFSRFFWIY